MIHIKYIIYQYLMLLVFIIINYFSDPYISSQFTHVDFIALLILAPIYILFGTIVFRCYEHFEPINIRIKIWLSIPACILAILSVLFIEFM